MKIYQITIFFFVGILILLIIFRCYSYFKIWSEFHRRYHPTDIYQYNIIYNSTEALQITFGVFLKVAVWGLMFLVLLIFYLELNVPLDDNIISLLFLAVTPLVMYYYCYPKIE